MTLYEAVLNSRFKKLKIAREHTGFWRDEGSVDYSELNNYPVYEDKDIRTAQLASLKQYEILAQKENQQARRVNNFLLSEGKFLDAETELQKSISNAFESIMGNIDSIRTSGGLSSKARQRESVLNKTRGSLKAIERALSNLKTSGINVNGTYINELVNALQSVEANGISADTVNSLMRNFFNLQGEVLEVLGTQFYNERIPKDIKFSKAITTGQLAIGGKQSISDLLILNVKEIDLRKDLTIEYKLDGKPYTLPLGDFLDLVEKYSGRKQINISSTTMDKISEVVISGIQAKSGINQLPWNKNKKVNIYDLHPAFTLLNQLYHDSIPAWWSKGNYMNKTSSAYQALANYGLKDHLDFILSLSQQKNNFLLTREGFVSYTYRINQLITQRNSYFKVAGRVDISAGTRQMMSVII